MELKWRMMTNTMMRVTPLTAAEWLKRNIANRPLSEPQVAQLVRDIVAGYWRTTHQGIAFDYNGNLIDGQHRLEAITRSGIACDVYVATGHEPEDRVYVDIGKKRSPVDAFQLSGRTMGFGSVGPKTEAGMWSRMMIGQGQNKGRETRAELLAFADEHRQAGEWTVAEFGQHPRSHGHTATVMGAVARAFYHVETSRLSEFVRVLSTGITVSEGTADHAAIHFRNALSEGRIRGNSNAAPDIYGKACRAISYFCERRSVTKFYAPQAEEFPLPTRESSDDAPGADPVARNGRLPIAGGSGSHSLVAAAHR
jgi:hypothetical protein